MSASSRHDPYAGFNFRVEIDGITVAAFSECSGLSSETSVVEYREGGEPRIRKLPGQTKFSNITLKRGVTEDRTLWEWRQTVVNGKVERRNGSVVCSTPPTTRSRGGTSSRPGRRSGKDHTSMPGRATSASRPSSSRTRASSGRGESAGFSGSGFEVLGSRF